MALLGQLQCRSRSTEGGGGHQREKEKPYRVAAGGSQGLGATGGENMARFLLVLGGCVVSASASSLVVSPKAGVDLVTGAKATEWAPVVPRSVQWSEPLGAASIHYVEVYENEEWTVARGWSRPWSRKRRAWTYRDGGGTLPPDELQLPDGWEWMGDWRIMRAANSTDVEGWRFAASFRQFTGELAGRPSGRLTDLVRRRRWVRLMRPVGSTATAREGAWEDGEEGRQLLGQVLLLLQGRVGHANDVGGWELVPAEALRSSTRKGMNQTPLARRLIEDFSFKGFGLTFTKSLLSYDVGLGFTLPITPNFQALERVVWFPSVSSCVAVYWPLCVSGWISVSYPADVLLGGFLRLIPGSVVTREGSKPRVSRLGARRASVERVGVSLMCRYSAATGLGFRMTPWLFVLPGLQVVVTLLAKLYILLLGSLEQLEQTRYQLVKDPQGKPEIEKQHQDVTRGTVEDAEMSTAVRRFRKWMDKKTVGLGYTVGMYKNRVGGSMLLSVSPLWLGHKRGLKRRRMAVTAPDAGQSEKVIPMGVSAQEAPQGVTSTVSTSLYRHAEMVKAA